MLGILGGSFDPIHYGHLHIAQSLHHMLYLQAVHFIPCKAPLLGKKIVANTAQRLAMLKLALIDYPYCFIDERELQRRTPSYTLDTLIALRHEFANLPLALILGSDNLTNLNRWYEWRALIQYAHLVIIPRRPDASEVYHPSVQAFIQKFRVQDVRCLQQQAAGFLLITHVKPLAISASRIRTEIAQGLRPVNLLPASVLDYITEEKLYL